LRKFARQVRLAEIGAAGQEKIAAAEVVVARGFAGSIEARYLAAAGVGKIAQGDYELADSRFDELDPAAREIALGARAAARALLEIVE
jgi:molybdopterin/thiamine biosynthesis adenylyltransferase